MLVAYLHSNTVSHSFSDSLMRLVAYDLAHEGRVVRTGGPVMFRVGSGGLVQARNDVMRHFLDSKSEWLWMIDSDMGFTPDTVDQLVGAADPVERPVVGGLCFVLREVARDGLQGWRTEPVPALYSWGKRSDGTSGFVAVRDYRVNALVQVAGTGAACLLVHRSVVERVGAAWFDRVRYADGTPVGEDLSFCTRLNSAGIPVFVHTGVRTNHHKQVWVTEDTYMRCRQVPPADEDTAVIVPVVRRPHAAEPFMRSLRASTGLAVAYAVIELNDFDTAEAWEKAGAIVVKPGDGQTRTFSQKINVGFRMTHEPWVLLVGDDVRFHSGWLDHAQHVARTQGVSVVGTNDLGNPLVLVGEHATHLLVGRRYVEDVGASWDGPGVVCHEGYRHWCVDNEIVTAAKQRGEWAMALGSHVEHLHPAWGKGAMDQVYEMGQQQAETDMELLRSRCEKFVSGAAR